MAEETAGQIITPPPPPRATGNPEYDVVAMIEWAWDFYNSQRSRDRAIEGSTFDPNSFDPSDLPDPATTNLAQAQTTANSAYSLAAQNASDIDDVQETTALIEKWAAGQLTISNTDTVGTFTFSKAQENTSYFAQLQPIGTTGSPTTDSLIVVDVTKATDDIEVTIQTAPGSGNSVIFDVLIYRLT